MRSEKSGNELDEVLDEESQKNDDQFIQDWLANLLSVLNASLSSDEQEMILQRCSALHYDRIHMQELLSQFRGNLVGFIQLLEDKWNWKIVVDPVLNVITADENKEVCVCPIVRLSSRPISGILCRCSEGFAERMFSGVVDGPVKAQVDQSILRGDPSCIYRIQIL